MISGLQMKFLMKRISLLLVLMAVGFFAAKAQKIGYTNVELILVYMPETQAMEKQLKTVEEKLLEQLEIKQKYYQTKMMEFMEARESGQYTDAQLQVAAQELEKLQIEVQQGLQQAEESLFKRRMQLLEPIQKKMQIAIDDVAKEKGFSYILNNAMGSGIPTILYGSETSDCTEAIAKKLGIETEE